MRRAILFLAVILVSGACSDTEYTTPAIDAGKASAGACSLGPEILDRIYRGFDPDHSEDVTIVPAEPNFWGSFEVVSHSGPWDYLQKVPLVLYGPGHVAANGPVDAPAHITDVYPTVEELLRTDLKRRSGRLLQGSPVSDSAAPPRLILTIMWDGVGRNMLDRWPDRWPNLARLEAEGTSYPDAEVGSSPSITPATHANLGTGAYPNEHGVTAIDYRVDHDTVRTAFAASNPKDLRLTTYADQFDKHMDNAPKVGLLAWRDWHMPMLGHGSMTPGGDRDHLALIGPSGKVRGNPAFYRTPRYLKGHEERFLAHAEELDKSDGVADGKWRGHDILDAYEDNPAFVRYQGDLAMKMLKRGGYGQDEVPDLWFANFKQTDIAGHQYTIDSPEVADVLFEQDRQLGRILRWLDREIGDYVVILSADHGHTPDPKTNDAWPIAPSETKADIYRAFDVPLDADLFASTTAVGPFLNRDVAERYGVTPGALARFFRTYTIADNVPRGEPMPDGYGGRADERVFAAAWPASRFDEVMAACDIDGSP